jgi:ATP-dependent helicase/nuclease subunit A
MTNLPSLNVVSAGAGSGKTFKIKETVGQWVKAGLVRPDRIVAVTFTEAAAAELKERLRKELIDLGRPEDALKLDQAYISTIHAFGLRILTEFAFDGGMPPRSRLLDRNEETALLRQAMATTGSLDVLTRELRRYGYAYDGGSQTSAEEQFRSRVRQIIGTLRTVGQNTAVETLKDFADAVLKDGYGPTCNGPLALEALHKAVTNLLDSFPSDISGEFAGNKAAVGQFRKNHTGLLRARDKGRLSTDWLLWRDLGKLRQSKRGAPTPDGYDELADAVILAAGKLSQHPGPLDDAVEHGASLIGSAFEATVGYGEEKRKSALVDYTDMVAMAYEIIKSGSGALKALAERIDCLVIDEFQDTNPLQFSLLWLLQRAGIPTLIVGDLKQAIMGFQGADPRLMEKLLRHEDATPDTLDNNWRTQPSLMPFTNAAGTALFGDGYVDLSARANEGFQAPLEILEQPKPPKGSAKRATWSLRIAERIRTLLDDPGQFVRDPHTSMKRRLVAGDIAILCPTNDQVQAYADALRLYGVRAKVAEDGWLSSRIVQLTSHVLQYIENPSDKHAALYLSCTEFGERDLQSAISELIDRGRIADPLLDRLQCFQDETNDVAIDVILARAIGALDLYGRIATWPDAAKHRADLLRLESEAKAFVEAKPETLASGGFFGSGAKTFLAWLSDKIQQDNEGDRRPDPDASTTDAVETVTWHRSKGREWPVVLVCGWDAGVNPKLPKVGVEYENFGNLDAALDEARISFIPEFAAKDVNNRFLAPMADATVLSAKRLIYVALTRAKERLVLEWHSHLTSSSRTTYHSIFQDTAGADLHETGLEISGNVFPCSITRNDGTPPDLPCRSDAVETLPTFGRHLLASAPMQEPQFEMFSSPSSDISTTVENPPSPEEFGYGMPLVLDIDLHGAVYGSMLHRCFEVLTASPASRTYLSDATGHVITEEQANAIGASHAALLDWLRENLSASDITAEVPFSTMTADGGVCTGIIDLLVETPNGLWVIDHKSDRSTDEGEIFGNYWPQLLAYQEALLELGHQVSGVGLNLVNEGKLLLARLQVDL